MDTPTPRVNAACDEQYNQYPHDLSVYMEPPAHQITLEEFSSTALQRLEVMRLIKAATDKGMIPMSSEWKQFIHDNLKKDNLNDYVMLLFHPHHTKSPESIRRRRADHIGHYILMLGHCHTEDKRQWLLQAEMDMFKLRFSNLSNPSIQEFIKRNEFPYKPIVQETRAQLREMLLDCTACLTSDEQFNSMEFYRVRFQEVPDLLNDLSVYVKGGFAYVPHLEIGSILVTRFRSHMSRTLVLLHKEYQFHQDPRFSLFLNKLSETYTGRNYSVAASGTDIPLSMLELLAMQSFPLCMRNIYETMKKDHHIRYNARQHLQLFFKGIGVSLPNCIEFFRSTFAPKCDANKFNKEYLYSIRHNYGQEGSKINYNPPSCLAVLNTSAGPADCHGCPYRTGDMDNLRKLLKKIGLSVQGTSEVLEFTKSGHAQIACGRVFELLHKNTTVAINHPNQYFEESQKFYGTLSGSKVIAQGK